MAVHGRESSLLRERRAGAVDDSECHDVMQQSLADFLPHRLSAGLPCDSRGLPACSSSWLPEIGTKIWLPASDAAKTARAHFTVADHVVGTCCRSVPTSFAPSVCEPDFSTTSVVRSMGRTPSTRLRSPHPAVRLSGDVEASIAKSTSLDHQNSVHLTSLPRRPNTAYVKFAFAVFTPHWGELLLLWRRKTLAKRQLRISVFPFRLHPTTHTSPLYILHGHGPGRRLNHLQRHRTWRQRNSSCCKLTIISDMVNARP